MSRTISKPKPLRLILNDTLKSMGIQGPMKGYSLWGAWKEIVGESVALNTQPSVIRNRILFIKVSHPTWIQQLQFLKPTLLEKLNGFLGEPLIEDIRFRLGKIAEASPSRERTPSWTEEELDQATRSRIETLLQKIEEGEARRTLQEILVRGAKVEKYRKRRK